MNDSLIWAPAEKLRDLIARKEVSPVEVVQASLDRIDALDSRLRAFIIVDRKGALDAARRAQTQMRDGARLGPLHGLPIALKDDLWVEGLPATAGSLIFSRFIPSRDGTVARRLRAAGAIIIGKTNLPEFTSWPRTRSYVGGESLNPWDTTRIPGASSGGSAVAVAAGMVPLAIGTDGGGSVRIPAALCGLVGLLPTIGRVPDYGSFLCSPLSSAGPMGRTVRDVALLQQVIAGFDPDVPSSLKEQSPDLMAELERGPTGTRIAWSGDFGRIAVEPGILDAARAALRALSAAGAKVQHIDITIPHPWGDGQLMAAVREAAGAWNAPDPEVFGEFPAAGFPEAVLAATTARGESYFSAPEVRRLIERYDHLLAPPQRLMAQHMQSTAPVPEPAQLCDVMDAIFASCDVLCSPTMAVVAPRVPPGWALPYADSYSGTNFTFIANATGRPAVSVPCGTAAGLPVGFQIIGRRGEEATVLRVARAVEAALPTLPHPTGIN